MLRGTCDAERTAGSAANVWRAMNGTVWTIAATEETHRQPQLPTPQSQSSCAVLPDWPEAASAAQSSSRATVALGVWVAACCAWLTAITLDDHSDALPSRHRVTIKKHRSRNGNERIGTPGGDPFLIARSKKACQRPIVSRS